MPLMLSVGKNQIEMGRIVARGLTHACNESDGGCAEIVTHGTADNATLPIGSNLAGYQTRFRKV